MQEYDFHKIKQLLKDFYNLTQIKICLYDAAGNEICYYPEKYTPFCKQLREDGAQDKLCRECDRVAFAECNRTHKPHSYVCHAGLLECFSPILYEDTVIGYIVIGQIRPQNEEQAPPIFQDELLALYQNLPIVPKDKIYSAMHVLEACASYSYLKTLIDLQKNRREDKIREYIMAHLTDDLSVQVLSDVFHVSRIDLYDVFKKAFNCTIAEFVKKCRLEKACSLLQETAFPVQKIAILCGIPDYNYFSKCFKKAYLLSPREYRKQTDISL